MDCSRSGNKDPDTEINEWTGSGYALHKMNQIRIKLETNGPGPDTQFANEPDPDKARNEWTGSGYAIHK